MKRTKTERDQDRDISEKIALGQAQPTTKGEAMFDQRLFNQTAGLGTGFGDDEDYHLYDKPLFTDRTAASIYKGVKTLDTEGAAEEGDATKTRVRKVLGSQAQGGDGGFDGQEASGMSSVAPARNSARSKPVEFEKTRLAQANDDPNYKAGL
jgi:SNW domain-containing protein 1